jgi:hypothetical protein
VYKKPCSTHTFITEYVTAGGEFPNALPKPQLNDCPVDSMYSCKRDGFLEPPCVTPKPMISSGTWNHNYHPIRHYINSHKL